jgi:hypothetical protein
MEDDEILAKQKLLNVLLAVAALIAALALATLVPFSSGFIKSDLGYSSLCPFAPWSTLTLLAFAGLVWLFRAYLKTQGR